MFSLQRFLRFRHVGAQIKPAGPRRHDSHSLAGISRDSYLLDIFHISPIRHHMDFLLGSWQIKDCPKCCHVYLCVVVSRQVQSGSSCVKMVYVVLVEVAGFYFQHTLLYKADCVQLNLEWSFMCRYERSFDILIKY